MKRIGMLIAVLALTGCGGPGPVVKSGKPGAASKPAAPPAVVAVVEAAALARKPAGLHKETWTMPGQGAARYALRVPATLDPAQPVPLVVLLHFGYDGPRPDPHTGADMIAAFGGAFKDWHAVILAPDALGGDWTEARNDELVVALTRGALKAYPIDPKKVVLAGFSMGGEGTWAVGSKHQDLFTAAIPVAAPVPAGGVAGWTIPAFAIHAPGDDIVPFAPAQRLANQLKAAGAPVEFRAAPGLSHYQMAGYVPHVQAAAAWVAARWK